MTAFTSAEKATHFETLGHINMSQFTGIRISSSCDFIKHINKIGFWNVYHGGKPKKVHLLKGPAKPFVALCCPVCTQLGWAEI